MTCYNTVTPVILFAMFAMPILVHWILLTLGVLDTLNLLLEENIKTRA